MTDESAKLLAEAMNKLADAINAIPRSNGLFAGISVYHHGIPNQYPASAYQSSYGGFGGNNQNSGTNK